MACQAAQAEPEGEMVAVAEDWQAVTDAYTLDMERSVWNPEVTTANGTLICRSQLVPAVLPSRAPFFICTLDGMVLAKTGLTTNMNITTQWKATPAARGRFGITLASDGSPLHGVAGDWEIELLPENECRLKREGKCLHVVDGTTTLIDSIVESSIFYLCHPQTAHVKYTEAQQAPFKLEFQARVPRGGVKTLIQLRKAVAAAGPVGGAGQGRCLPMGVHGRAAITVVEVQSTETNHNATVLQSAETGTYNRSRGFQSASLSVPEATRFFERYSVEVTETSVSFKRGNSAPSLIFWNDGSGQHAWPFSGPLELHVMSVCDASFNATIFPMDILVRGVQATPMDRGACDSGPYHIKSVHGSYLCCTAQGLVTASPTPVEDSNFEVAFSVGKAVIKSRHGLFVVAEHDLVYGGAQEMWWINEKRDASGWRYLQWKRKYLQHPNKETSMVGAAGAVGWEFVRRTP